VLLTGGLPDPAAPGLTVKTVSGGFLAQTRDAGRIGPDDLKLVTGRAPTDQELADLVFAFRVCKHVKSNAIVYAGVDRTLGIGAPHRPRVDASRIAVWKAQEAGLSLQGSAVASDAFFPFSDGLIAAAEAGATAAIQPGGSVRDEEVIAAANERNVAMVFTGVRHFRH
jgi:phosphoribosylaminoimidazolecarboxamide formyltransferase/IMP cyclohydrolase